MPPIGTPSTRSQGFSLIAMLGCLWTSKRATSGSFFQVVAARAIALRNLPGTDLAK